MYGGVDPGPADTLGLPPQRLRARVCKALAVAGTRDRRHPTRGSGARPVPEEVVDGQAQAELRDLVVDWLNVPEVAEACGCDVLRVRRMLAEGDLVAVRLDQVLQIPAAFLTLQERGTAPMPELRGTLSVLGDAGYSTSESVRWLFTRDETLREGRPVDTLRAGRKTEIRRRAQALGF